ncbi:MAG: DUF4097 family beta strand repeat-containing protein [Clostridiales bacterium]|nr:DUF4097 family beta strand repeat-containing protein [Clostridiales bacterium]
MKRSEYMSKLSEALEIFGEDVKLEIMEDYEEHYEIGLQNGKSEEQISEELGEIEELVKELKKSEITEKRPDKTVTLEKMNGEIVGNQTSFVTLEKGQGEQSFKNLNEFKGNQTNDDQPRKIEVRSKFAHVEVTRSMDDQIRLEWVNYQTSRAKDYYEFRSWMEGGIIYGELCKKNSAVLFVPMFGGDVQIKVQVPNGFPELEVQSLSGDTVMHDVSFQSVELRSASGNIEVDHSNTNQMALDTKSGKVICKQSQAANLNVDTKSGNTTFFQIQSSTIHVHSLSGDVRGDHLTGDCNVSTASGDITIASATGRQNDFYSVSGEIEIEHLQGESIKLQSKSGDIEAEICVKNCTASSISGDIEIKNAQEGCFTLSSVSGDVELTCNNIAGYVADVHTVSGKTECRFRDIHNQKLKNGVYTYGAGSSKIKAKTTSGDIEIRA